MQYFLKQKLLSVGDDFEAFDETGTLAYYFDGKVMSIGKKILILDKSGKEIGRIRGKLFTFRPTFVVTRNHRREAVIFKKLLTFKPGFLMRMPDSEPVTITGSLLEHDYYFYRNGAQIASVKKKWFQGSDSYGVDISSGDSLLILCAAVVIDLVCHPKRDSSFGSSRR